MLQCSKQIITLRMGTESLNVHRASHCYSLEVTAADFSDLGRKHTQSEPSPLRFVTQTPPWPIIRPSLDLSANALFVCTPLPHLLIQMVCYQQLGCDACADSYIHCYVPPPSPPSPSYFHLWASSPNRGTHQTTSAASLHLFYFKQINEHKE